MVMALYLGRSGDAVTCCLGTWLLWNAGLVFGMFVWGSLCPGRTHAKRLALAFKLSVSQGREGGPTMEAFLEEGG